MDLKRWAFAGDRRFGVLGWHFGWVCLCGGLRLVGRDGLRLLVLNPSNSMDLKRWVFAGDRRFGALDGLFVGWAWCGDVGQVGWDGLRLLVLNPSNSMDLKRRSFGEIAVLELGIAFSVADG
jgi:hypothetical protein